MDYSINSVRLSNLLAVKTQGRMNGRDFILMAGSLLKHPLCSPNGDVLFDHTELEFAGVPEEDLRMIREFHKDHEVQIGNGRSAIVVKPGQAEVWYKLWSQGEKLRTANQVQVFENYGDAVAWMNEGGAE